MRLQLLAAIAFTTAAVVSQAEDLMPAEKAYRVEVRQVGSNMFEVDYHMAPGYILYKDRFSLDGLGTSTKSEISLPPAQTKFDTTTQKPVEHYRGSVTVRVAIPLEDPRTGEVGLTAQGCAIDVGVCYPPIRTPLKQATFTGKVAHPAEGTCSAARGKGLGRAVQMAC